MRRKQRGKKVTGFTNTEEAAVGLTKVVPFPVEDELKAKGGIFSKTDADRMEAYPPGTVLVLPGDTFHFHWTKSGEYVTQVTGIGPLGIEYMDAKDDPRNEGRRR